LETAGNSLFSRCFSGLRVVNKFRVVEFRRVLLYRKVMSCEDARIGSSTPDGSKLRFLMVFTRNFLSDG